MLSLQEISDRLEIQDLLARYSHAIDRHDFDALDGLFTDDAVVDYSEFGGPRGDLGTIKTFLAEVMPLHSGHQHLVGSVVIDLHGDEAAARSVCHNPMLLAPGPDAPAGAEPRLYFCGLWYRDSLVRTPQGWRIRERYEEKSYLWSPRA